MSRAHKIRSAAVFLILILFSSLLIVRLVFLQCVDRGRFIRLARTQHDLLVKLNPRRGTIYDCRGREMAVAARSYSVFASPRSMTDKEIACRKLAAVLKRDENEIRRLLEKDKAFVWLARKVSNGTAREVNRLKIKGVDLLAEDRRLYPNGRLACHLLGIVNIDNEGMEGLELYYDRYLRGEPGWRRSARDGKQREVLAWGYESMPPVEGLNLVLTVDQSIQYIAEKGLKKVVDRYHPLGATIVLIKPDTGAILALANWPDFDSNDFGSSPVPARRNRAATDIYEPGSVFKIVTAAAVLRDGLFKPEDVIFCENGLYCLGKDRLRDYHPYGNLTFREVIAKSSNIGTAKVAGVLGRYRLSQYVRGFGFGGRTGIDLPGEVAGSVSPLVEWTRTRIMRVPIGQGIAVTSIQLVRAMAAIANSGVMVRPRVVDRIEDKYGQTIKTFPPETIGRVIPEETARTLTEILTQAVEDGTGGMARIPGYKVAGKTGTAQKIEPGGGYSQDRYMSVFAGYAPVERPVIAAIVVVDEPRGNHFGGVVSAPVFADVVGEVLRYWQVPLSPPEGVYVKSSPAGGRKTVSKISALLPKKNKRM